VCVHQWAQTTQGSAKRRRAGPAPVKSVTVAPVAVPQTDAAFPEGTLPAEARLQRTRRDVAVFRVLACHGSYV
jgi:hypothetical protein